MVTVDTGHAIDTGDVVLVPAGNADGRGGAGIGSTALAFVRNAPCPVVLLPSASRA